MSAVEWDPADQAGEIATLYRLTDRLYRARSAEDVYAAALDAIVGMLGCARTSILLFDDAGVMRFVASRGLSPEYRQDIEGHTPWQRGEPDPHPIFVSDIDNTDEPARVKAVVKREGIRALAFIPLVAHGGVVGKFMTYYEAPRQFSAHEVDIAVTIARQVGFSIERWLSERARQAAEQQLRESEERFRLMCEHAPVMMWMTDASGKCLQLNKLLRDFWGVEEAGIEAFDWSATIHPEDAARVTRTMADAIARRTNVHVKARYRSAAGQYHTWETEARPRFTGERFLGMIGANVDVTEREEADASRRQAEAHRELLIAELNHRVKNTLSVVQAIARQTFQRTAENARNAFNGRLAALAHSHDLLTQANWERVSLQSLAATALQLHEGAASRVSLHGPSVLLPSRAALALGMAFHELQTNALKYGALSNGDGRVTVTWHVTAEGTPQLILLWREQGGPLVNRPSRRGFGSLLLERILTGDLNAGVKLDYQPTGLVCSITAQLSALAPADRALSAP